MIIDELVGIIVLKCSCGQRFVVNTELMNNGVAYKCKCGKGYHIPQHSNLEIKINYFHSCLDYTPAERRELFKPLNNNEAMPLEEYKALLSKIIIDGKAPKVPARSKKVVAFNTNQEAIINTVDALMAQGWSYDDAKEKVSIAISEGFYTDNELINHILTS